MRKALKEPITWFLFQSIFLIFIVLKFDYFKVFFYADSNDYANYFPSSSSGLHFLQLTLSGYRTFGYPLFLKAVGVISPDYELLPVIHILVHIVAVFVFFGALRMFGFSKWAALITASPLLCEKIIIYSCRSILTESLSTSLSILTIGLLVMLVCRPRNCIYWASLTVVTFLTYQVRPDRVFLILMIPIIGFILYMLQNRKDNNEPHCREAAGLSLKLFASGIIPLILFCSIRLAVVGDFGLTSFAGINLIGITGQMLSNDMLEKLPSDTRPLAQAIIQDRARLGAQDELSAFGWENHGTLEKNLSDYTWQSYVSIAIATYNSRNLMKDYYKKFNGFNNDINSRVRIPNAEWKFSAGQNSLMYVLSSGEHLPEIAFKSPYKTDDGFIWVKVNKELTKLSLHILKLKTRTYVMIVANSFIKNIYETMDFEIKLNMISYLLCVIWFASQVFFSVKANTLSAKHPSTSVKLKDGFNNNLVVILVIGISYLLIYSSLVALVEVPIPRYTLSAGTFLWSIMTTGIFTSWERFSAVRSAVKNEV